ncbi:CBS domain-containing protein [Cribrihabitans neustonicus]|uniref:CBS domain-containing protein n=1 Tax=Cribrihabitans neustonicus TaxID=1429085 RepID=UPI003B596240
MMVQEIMSAPLRWVHPQEDIATAALQMRRLGVGALAVVEAERIVGFVTDRDLILALAGQEGFLSGIAVSNCMTARVICCRTRDSVEAAAALMGDHQIRRLPVLDEKGRLAGLLSVSDIAVHASEQLAGEALGEIAEFR